MSAKFHQNRRWAGKKVSELAWNDPAVIGSWAPLSCSHIHSWLSISGHNSQRLNFFNFLLYITAILVSYTKWIVSDLFCIVG